MQIHCIIFWHADFQLAKDATLKKLTSNCKVFSEIVRSQLGSVESLNLKYLKYVEPLFIRP